MRYIILVRYLIVRYSALKGVTDMMAIGLVGAFFAVCSPVIAITVFVFGFEPVHPMTFWVGITMTWAGSWGLWAGVIFQERHERGK